IEKPATLNIMAHGAMGGVIPQGTIHLDNLLDEASLGKIAESTSKRIWTKFIGFGSFTAGLIGVYVTIRIMKLIINAVLNGIALHAAYGWSIRLLVAIWSTLAYFCIFLKQKKEETVNTGEGAIECVPLPLQNNTNTPPFTTDTRPSTPRDAETANVFLSTQLYDH
ncbi:hypothetical protein WH47_07218, partial [Habropoda laboriosa]